MLSPVSQLTSHRILTTGAILAVIFIILLTLYNPRDATAASNGSLVQLSGDKPTSDATISTPGNEQETGKITADNGSPSAIAETSAVNVAMSSAPAVPNEPRRAFVAFLEAHTGTNRGDEAQGMTTDDEDDYFVATRVLGYQLMHQPETRSNTSIPFIVVASSEVSQSKRARLEKDGAKVVVVDGISDPEWLDTKRQYQGIMTKLRVFQQTEYEKMLYMDADMFITRRLDAIFEDEGTRIQRPKKEVDNKKEAAPLPSSFMLAGQAQQTDRVHKYPPDPSLEWMCSGFMVFKPSQEIFEYYTSIMERENSFDPNFPDQNLLNYAHRWDGPMPWTNVYYKWTSTYPSIKEYAMGAAALHEKYWMDYNRVEAEGQNIIGDMWLKVHSDMEAFYRDNNG
ncbi:hypothetical protein HO173_008905 [Letharia columbiana]|uniref:Nucleotide-diphospho-sugar transferase n=1 Tax=Letharia columbiana TaxID=112416 RepID=A0A8H6FQQ8_9LECA|nr:uncharacterized protein HO173_008905 [Letharia columbiana]KAF6232942.1 hypothetical protein HO173_008905 [Letharia columbiana]